MENHKMNYTTSVKFVRSHSRLAIGLGLIYFSVVRINDLGIVSKLLGHLSVYWSPLAESMVAFVGVIAANIVLNLVKK